MKNNFKSGIKLKELFVMFLLICIISSSYNNLFSRNIKNKPTRQSSLEAFSKGDYEQDIKETAITRSILADAEPSVVDTVRKNLNKALSERLKLPSAYEKILDEALDFQFKSDSVNSVIAAQKKEMEKLTGNEKTALKVKISQNEILAASFQKSADQKYSEVEKSSNPQQESIQAKEIIPPEDKKVLKDSVQQSANKSIKEPDKQLDTIKKIVPVVKKPVETFTAFEVLAKPVTDPKEKILINPEVPPGLIYRIQIAVFRNPVAPSYFKGIMPVFGFKVAGTDKTNYYAGMFRRMVDANRALTSVKAKGFKDAFVVPFSGNKAVSADRAALLEKEWGKKPFVTAMKNDLDIAVDTIPPTLSFRVEVTRVLKPLKDDVIEGIKKMAGNRGLDILDTDDGNIVYLIGKFITFESAAEYADLLNRNGYRESKVVAWLGNREIPLETAKQLFDDIE